MHFLILLILFSSLPVFSEGPKSLLSSYCEKVNGKVSSSFTCPRSKLPLPWKFCITQDNSGRTLFFDGCTGPTNGFASLFYPACIRHDLCYHHEPVTSGLKKIDCDRDFLSELTQLCHQGQNKDLCLNQAKVMYRGVRAFGALAYSCDKSEADYQLQL